MTHYPNIKRDGPRLIVTCTCGDLDRTSTSGVGAASIVADHLMHNDKAVEYA